MTVVTPEDIERYLSAVHAAQSIDAMRDRFPRWSRRLAAIGVGDVPLSLGSASGRFVDLFANQASKESSAQRMAHQQRDTMPEIRPYKG